MELSSIYGINTDAVNTLKNVSLDKTEEGNDMFASLLNTAIDNINSTNALLSNAENEEIKFALGETTNPHDLTIALQKASAALQYTIAVRDKFLEAYKEIMLKAGSWNSNQIGYINALVKILNSRDPNWRDK